MSEIRFNLTPYVENLTEIMIEIALKRYGNSIAIIAMYGSRARGDYDDDSDLEFISVIEDDKKVDIEFTFMGIPIDAWGQKWSEFEKVSSKESYWVLPAGTIATCKIIYARSDEDRDRFESIRAEALKSGKSYEKNLKKATEYHQGMFEFLGKIQYAKFSNDKHEARRACWHLIISATYIIAHINSKYLLHNWGQNLHELFTFENQPTDLRNLLEKLITETNYDKMLVYGSNLIENLRQYMISATRNRTEESSLEMLRTSDCVAYLNKIKKASRKKDIYSAGYAVFDFQALVARDLIKLANKWDQSTKFKLYSEYKALYDEKYPDFFDAVTNGDFKALQELADSMYDDLLEYNKTKVHDFKSLEEIKDTLL